MNLAQKMRAKSLDILVFSSYASERNGVNDLVLHKLCCDVINQTRVSSHYIVFGL